jgi:hypothetical protein
MLDLRALRSASFRHLALALWINEFGNWIGEIALAIVIYNRTRSPLATASLFLAMRFLPALVAPLLTVRAEAIRPRVILPFMYLAEAALYGGLALMARHFSLPIALALITVDGVLAIASTTLTRSAIATGLIATGLLREGNGLMNLGTMIAVGGAPAIAGTLIAWRGAGVALVIDAATFVLAAITVATAAGVRLESDLDAGSFGRLRSGAAVLRSHRAVRRLLLATTLGFGLSQIVIPVEVVFAKSTLHAGDTGYGLLLSSWGVGMIIGGAGFAFSREIRLMPLLALGTAVVAVGYGGLAASPTLLVACAFSCTGGIGNGAAWVAAKTALQERLPLLNQSAVMSVFDSLNQALPAIGFVIGGVITSLTSPRIAYAASAAGVAAVLMFCVVWPIDRVPLDPVMDGPKSSDTPSAPAPTNARSSNLRDFGVNRTAQTTYSATR